MTTIDRQQWLLPSLPVEQFHPDPEVRHTAGHRQYPARLGEDGLGLAAHQHGGGRGVGGRHSVGSERDGVERIVPALDLSLAELLAPVED